MGETKVDGVSLVRKVGVGCGFGFKKSDKFLHGDFILRDHAGRLPIFFNPRDACVGVDHFSDAADQWFSFDKQVVMALVARVIPRLFRDPFSGFVSMENLAFIGEQEVGQERGVEFVDARDCVFEAASRIHSPISAKAFMRSENIRQRRSAPPADEVFCQRSIEIRAEKPYVRHVDGINTRPDPEAIFLSPRPFICSTG
jgi:hypothetical protein